MKLISQFLAVAAVATLVIPAIAQTSTMSKPMMKKPMAGKKMMMHNQKMVMHNQKMVMHNQKMIMNNHKMIMNNRMMIKKNNAMMKKPMMKSTMKSTM